MKGGEDNINMKSVRFIVRVWNLSPTEFCPVAYVFLRNVNPSDFSHSSPLSSSDLCARKIEKLHIDDQSTDKDIRTRHDGGAGG